MFVLNTLVNVGNGLAYLPLNKGSDSLWFNTSDDLVAINGSDYEWKV